MELPISIAVTVTRDGLVVTPYLGEVGCLELHGELHERVGDVSGGLVGDGIFGGTRHGDHSGLRFDRVFHAEALAFDDDRLSVVQDPVEDGRGQGAVVVEDL